MKRLLFVAGAAALAAAAWSFTHDVGALLPPPGRRAPSEPGPGPTGPATPGPVALAHVVEIEEARARAHDMARAGDLEDALTTLRTVHRRFGPQKIPRATDEAATRLDHDLVALLVQAADGQTARGRHAAGARLLREADAVELTDRKLDEQVHIRLANTLVHMAREEDNRERRRELLEEAAEVAESPAALGELGELCDELNDLACAVDAYRRLSRASPQPWLAEKLDRLERQQKVEGNFGDARGEHFVVRFEGYAQERLAWAALRTLERAFIRVGDRLGLRPDEPITVVVYTGGQYAQALSAPDWTGGLYDGKIRIREGDLADEQGRLDDLLFHEYTHAALNRAVRGALPAWMHEGLAQAMEPSHTEGAGQRKVRHLGKVMALSQLTGSFTALADTELVAVAYAQSEAFLEHLLHKQGTLGLGQLFDAMNQGTGFEEAFQRVYFKAPDDALEEWKESLR